MTQNTIALICDCDGTLCPDTATLLVEELGLQAAEFWAGVSSQLVETGWDPPLAWITDLIRRSRDHLTPALTRDLLATVGGKIQFYPGALTLAGRIRDKLADRSEFREAGINLEWYIVSSGIEDILFATQLETKADAIFGCRLAFDEHGIASSVKSSVTFTEKTKFIYAINKGISREELLHQPYRVNDAIKPTERRIPFTNMVYLGDGPSDIPCFSMIKSQNGRAIGVTPPEDKDWHKPYELAAGERITVGPYSANYEDQTDLFKMLWRIIESIGDSIVEARAHTLRSAPRY